MQCLVTGASGFVGGHVAQALVERGDQVRALVRATSDKRFLNSIGVEQVEGDLLDAEAVRRAVAGCQTIVHCAAKVGDWGPIEEYRAVNVDALRVLLDAAVQQPCHRFVLVSSLGVYEARDHFGTDERTKPPELHFDGYTQTKVEAERLALEYAQSRGLPLVILRPGFIYGPRDRTIMPRLLFNLKWRLVTYFGSREKKLNNVYVGNVVAAVLLAIDRPEAVGQIYNITDGRCVTKREFFEIVCRLSRLPRPLATYPMWLARLLCNGFEWLGRTLGFEPLLNGARLKFMGFNLDYSIEKARRELGYQPPVSFEEGIRATIDWLRAEGHIR